MRNFKTSRCNVQRSIIYNEKLALFRASFCRENVTSLVGQMNNYSNIILMNRRIFSCMKGCNDFKI